MFKKIQKNVTVQQDQERQAKRVRNKNKYNAPKLHVKTHPETHINFVLQSNLLRSWGKSNNDECYTWRLVSKSQMLRADKNQNKRIKLHYIANYQNPVFLETISKQATNNKFTMATAITKMAHFFSFFHMVCIYILTYKLFLT